MLGWWDGSVGIVGWCGMIWHSSLSSWRDALPYGKATSRQVSYSYGILCSYRSITVLVPTTDTLTALGRAGIYPMQSPIIYISEPQTTRLMFLDSTVQTLLEPASHRTFGLSLYACATSDDTSSYHPYLRHSIRYIIHKTPGHG